MHQSVWLLWGQAQGDEQDYDVLGVYASEESAEAAEHPSWAKYHDTWATEWQVQQ